jgi:hypothetical protein
VHHEPIFRLVFGYLFDDYLLVCLAFEAFVDLGKTAVSYVTAQFVRTQIGMSGQFQVLRVLDQLVLNVKCLLLLMVTMVMLVAVLVMTCSRNVRLTIVTTVRCCCCCA